MTFEFGRSYAGREVAKRRLDSLLVERGLAESRERARAAVMAGGVRVDCKPATRPGLLVPEDAALELAERPRFVSRGGEKLADALARFGLDVAGLVAVDVGASTGGFTDCLLQHGARRVYAVDVGYGQLDYRLRTDPRVVVMERTNARHLTQLPEPADLVTMDVSFISLRLVLPAVRRLLRPGGRIVALFKPQFEARRGEVGRGGVVRDPLLHASLLGRFVSWAVSQRLYLRELALSPLRGPAGNREFLLLIEPAEDS